MKLKVDEVDDRSAIDRDDPVSRSQSQSVPQRAFSDAGDQPGKLGGKVDTSIGKLADFRGHGCSRFHVEAKK